MKQKKGVVLFVTILFILAVSVLIVKNLEITDQFIDISAKNNNIKQLEISIKDINREIIKLFKNKQSSILDDFPPVVPFDYGNISVELTLKKHDLILYKLDENLTGDSYLGNTVDVKILKEIIKGKKITNQRQVDAVIDEYVTKTNDRDILDIENQLVYFSFPESNTTKDYISCQYDVDIDGLKANVDMIFEANTNQEKQIPIKLDIIIKR